MAQEDENERGRKPDMAEVRMRGCVSGKARGRNGKM